MLLFQEWKFINVSTWEIVDTKKTTEVVLYKRYVSGTPLAMAIGGYIWSRDFTFNPYIKMGNFDEAPLEDFSHLWLNDFYALFSNLEVKVNFKETKRENLKTIGFPTHILDIPGRGVYYFQEYQNRLQFNKYWGLVNVWNVIFTPSISYTNVCRGIPYWGDKMIFFEIGIDWYYTEDKKYDGWLFYHPFVCADWKKGVKGVEISVQYFEEYWIDTNGVKHQENNLDKIKNLLKENFKGISFN